MKSRGMKQWAVMAMKDSWSKPKFLWTEYHQLAIFDRKCDAIDKATMLKNARSLFWDRAKGSPDIVAWIVVPVWTETMERELVWQ